MNQRTIVIASVLMAAALTGIFTISPLAYADESETSTDQETKQKNVGVSGLGPTRPDLEELLLCIRLGICGGESITPVTD